MEEVSYAEVVRAYRECRRNKPKNMSRIRFEYNLEFNLYELWEQLNSDAYEIDSSICFVVLEPKVREIWAADFRDRVVHHLVYNRIFNSYLRRFIKDTYSCIPRRGTFNGMLAVEEYAREISGNYTRRAYYMKCDIKNFFVSIDKEVLFEELKRHVKDEFILRLLHRIIFNKITKKVIVRSPEWKFDLLPEYKSLWHTPDEKGLPIGNLTSQFFSNVYLNVLDQYVKHKLKCKYYCRYVDDFILMSCDPHELVRWHKELTVFLKERLHLDLHYNKRTINLVEKGIDFVGYVVKPHRRLIRQKTLKKIFRIIRTYRDIPDWYDEKRIEKFVSRVNSYLGLLRGVNGYRLRRELCGECINLFIGCDSEYTKIYSVIRRRARQEFKQNLKKIKQ